MEVIYVIAYRERIGPSCTSNLLSSYPVAIHFTNQGSYIRKLKAMEKKGVKIDYAGVSTLWKGRRAKT